MQKVKYEVKAHDIYTEVYFTIKILMHLVKRMRNADDRLFLANTPTQVKTLLRIS